MSFWYKFEGLDNNDLWPTVFSFLNADGDLVMFGQGYQNTVALLHAATRVDGQDVDGNLEVQAGWALGTWVHYALVLYRSNGDAHRPSADWAIFKNGVKVAQTVGPYPWQGPLKSNVIGRNIETGPSFAGKIDSFNVFPYALTQQQITALYQTSVPGLVSTLSHMHACSESSGVFAVRNTLCMHT
jgi:hypothetical protein